MGYKEFKIMAKENSHFGCVVFIIILCISLSVLLGHSLKNEEFTKKDSRIYNSTDMDRADSVLRIVRIQQLSEYPEVVDLSEKVLEMKDRLDIIKKYAEDAEELLDDAKSDPEIIDDVQELLSSIIDNCN